MRGIFVVLVSLVLTTTALVYTWNHSFAFKFACFDRPLAYSSRLWSNALTPAAPDSVIPDRIKITGHVEKPVLTSTCTNPSARKDWRSLTDGQKEAWIDAVKCLVKLPSSDSVHPPLKPPIIKPPTTIIIPHNTSGSLYDDFSYVHIGLNEHIHQTGLFFPWHRYFLWSFEQTLRLQCNFTEALPYWDWTQDTADFEHSTMFDPDPKKGLGGFGHPAQQWAVLNGAFARLPLAYPIPHILRREYKPYPFINLTRDYFPDATLAAVDAMNPVGVSKAVGGFQGDYKGFQSDIEAMQGAHMSVHMIIGGDMGGSCPEKGSAMCDPNPDAKWSPNEPLFWLHHAMIDKLWYDWQHAHSNNFWAFEGGTGRDLYTWPRYRNGAPPAMTVDYELPADGLLLGNYTIQHMFNTTSNGPLCYVYD